VVANADNEIADWVEDYIENSMQVLGLSDVRTTWPGPRDLQTAWAIHAYAMARIVLNVGFGEAVDDGDSHDAHHYASGCYADVLVTSDRDFRKTMQIIPNSPITVLHFNQFAAQFGVQPH
jgi:hypothetical protein